MLQVIPLTGIGSVTPGDDLAQLVMQAAEHNQVQLQDHDVIVLAQKMVSKAEHRYRSLSQIQPSQNAIALAEETAKDPRLVQLILDESCEIVRKRRGVLITRHRLGLVMANAGIDASNLEGGVDRVLLLPENPDDSAALVQQQLQDRYKCALSVIISDSFGRPWRQGVTNVAIGAAGLPSLLDRRQDTDRSGRVLKVTQIAVADLVASAAGLVMGEADEGIPAAIVKGLPQHYRGDKVSHIPASNIIRPVEEDLFR